MSAPIWTVYFQKSASHGPEFVFIRLEFQKGCYITLGNVYRSPKSTHADDLQLCSELEQLAAEAKKDVIIVGDFNFPEIDWDLHHSINNSYGSTVFLNTLHKLLLLQHVNFPTRARGTDTPHLLDLVITDDQLINNIDPLPPLGKSDHVVLMIETNIFNSESRVEQKFNNETISAASGPKLTILWGNLEDILLLNKFFFRLSIRTLVAKIQPNKVVRWCADGKFLVIFCILYFQRATCSMFQTCILNLH